MTTRNVDECNNDAIIRGEMTQNIPLTEEQIERQTSYWLDLADYDMATARTMLIGGHYLYVGFMCHQMIEKGLKGLYVSTLKEQPPFSHALVKLAKLAQAYDFLPPKEQALLDMLEPLNIEARYPSQKDALLQALTAERCKMLIADTERLLIWIKSKCGI